MDYLYSTKKRPGILLASLVSLALLLSASVAGADEKRYKIKFKEGRGADIEQVIKDMQGKRVKRKGKKSRRLLAAELTRTQLRKLRKNRFIESIEVDERRYLMAELVPYGVTMVQASAELSQASGHRKVCIVDTGYYRDHEDLPVQRVSGDSQIPGEQWSEDGNGHGTHVAGTIAALGGNDTGVIGVHSGINLDLHIVKVFNNNGLWTFSSDLIAALDQCKAAGSHVVSMSLGGGYSASEETVFAQAASDGMLIVAAAGNSGNSSYSYPASYDSVLSVAAVNASETLASFSQTNDQVELAAPGVGVLSTWNANPSDYNSISGTSMATPHVSAVAAVLWGLYPACSASDIRGVLGAMAKDLGSPGRDNSYGFGLVQLQDADDYMKINGCASPTPPPPPPTPELANGVPLEDLSGGAGSTFDFEIPLLAGVTNLSVTINNGSGDADLYLRADGAPTLSVYDCRPWLNGNNEQCGDANPPEGTYFGMVHGYTSYAGVTLTATWDEAGPPPVNQAPNASISASVNEGFAPLTVFFDSGASTDDNGIVNRVWNFGDDTETAGAVAISHTFNTPGSYTVRVTVSDEQDLTDFAETTVTVNENLAPVASASVTPAAPKVGENVQFDASSSYDPDGNITGYAWQFGDGATGSGQTVQHVFSSEDTFNGQLTVTDNAGASNATDFSVVVSAAPPPPTAITASWSLNRKGTRMRVFFSGATTRRVEIYRNDTRVARTRNDGRWNDKNPIADAVYVVCNDGTNECSQP